MNRKAGTRAVAVYTLATLALSVPVFAASSEVISLNNDGVKALNANNFQLAIQKFEGALKLDPNYELARQNLAITYNNYGLQLQNNPQEAIKQFHKALYVNPSNTTTIGNLDGIIGLMHKNPHSFKDRVELGDQARLAGDTIGAAVEYAEAIKIQDDPKIHMKLGDVYRVRDELDKAITEFTAGTKAGDSAELEVRLGQAYQSKQDIPNAIAAYGKALALKSDDPDVLDALVAGWEEALKENPTAPENHIGLGQAFQYRGDFDQAAAEYKQALFFDRNNSTAQRLLANLAQEKQRAAISKHVDAGVDLQSRKLYDQAIEEYKIAQTADPRNASILVNIGSAYQQKGDFDTAIQSYQQALSLDSSNKAAQQGIQASTEAKAAKAIAQTASDADAAFKIGNYADAITKYQQLLRNNPQDAATHFNLGAAYQANKDLDQAMAEYRQAILLDPKNETYPKDLEEALELKAKPLIEEAVQKHQQKDYTTAIDLYQQALAIRPKNVGIWFDLAGAYYARQDYLKAQQAYQKALELDPKGQVDNIYTMALIDENFDKGSDALSGYQRYLAQAPNGKYTAQARERIQTLNKNINDTIKIKSDEELTKIKDASDSYQQAVDLQKQQKWDEAAAAYQKAINLQPQESSYPFGLGTLYQAQGNLDMALKLYQNALSLDPKNKDYSKAIQDAYDLKAGPLVDQAVKKYTTGDAVGAADLYQQALQIVPNNARLWTNLGGALQNSDNFSGARDAYQKAIDLDSKGESGNWYFIAALDENAANGSKALQEYERYVSQNPGGQYTEQSKARIKALSANSNNIAKLETQTEVKQSKEAQDDFDQGVKAQQANQNDEAIALYQKAYQLVPNEPAYNYALGTAYQAKNDYDSAIDWYKKAISLDPQNAEYKKILAAAYDLKAGPIMDEAVKKHTAGDAVGAIPLYQQALSISPNNAHGWTNLGSAYQATDDYSHAREAYQKGLDLDPQNEADNNYFIAAIDETFSQGSKALREYMKYISAAPKGGYVALAQQRIKALSANPNDVQKLVSSAEQKKSGEADSAYQAAVKLQQDNKLDDAIAQYKQALSISPNEHSYWYGLGTAYQAKNDADNALSAYEKASTLNPTEPAYKQLIGQLKQAKAQPLVDSAIKKQTTKDDKGNYDLVGAIADYEAALRLYDDPSTRLNLGTAYQANNNIQKAISEYNKALQMDPKQVDARYYLGTAYEALKQPVLALTEYKKYLALAPTGANAADARDRVKILSGH